MVITDQQAAAVEAFNDSKTKLGNYSDGFLNQITVAVAPAFQKIIEYIIEFIKQSGGMKGVADKVAKFMIPVAEGFITAFQTVGKVIDWVASKIGYRPRSGHPDRLRIVGEAIAAGTTDPGVINTQRAYSKRAKMKHQG